MQKLVCLLVFSVLGQAYATNTVHHPVPKEPLFLESGWYSELKTQIPKPPAAGTAEQASDEKVLREEQKARTADDCARAKTEVFVSLDNFFGVPRGTVDANGVKELTDFFEQIRNDGDYFVQKLKKEFPRKRPFAYVNGLTPCVPQEVTGAYPSGHAVLSRLYALVLTDFYPNQKPLLEKRADQIAHDRVLSGMHHPSDIEAGKKIGDLLHTQLLKSKKYHEAFEAEKAALNRKG